MLKFAKRADLSNLSVPRCTLYDRVDRLAPVTYIQGGALAGCVCLGWVSAIDARSAVEGRFDDVAGDAFHGCCLLDGTGNPLKVIGTGCVRV